MRPYLSTFGHPLMTLLLGVLTAVPASAITYTVTDLGLTPATGIPVGLGINRSGQTVGTRYQSGSNSVGFLYANGQTTYLGALPGGDYSSVESINDSGQITGDSGKTGQIMAAIRKRQPSGRNAVAPFTHAFVYAGGVMKDLGILPGGTYSRGKGINAGGQITGAADSAGRSAHAFLYDGTLKDLGTLGGSSSYGLAINNSGQVTGTASLSDGTTHAFLYANGVMQDLGAAPGGISSQGNSINNSGQITGASIDGVGNTHAFLYTNGSMTDLGPLPGGAYSIGNAISDAGQVTGESTVPGNGSLHAFLYADGKMTDMNTLLSASDQQTWTLTSGNAINSAGQVAAFAMNNGELHAVLLNPDTPIHPNSVGSADLLFQGQSKGSVAYATVHNMAPGASGYIFSSVNLDYKVVGAADLNGDGTSDMLFQSKSNGSVSYALMNGLAPNGTYGYLFPTVPSGFVVAGTPDLNGNGHPDILFQKQSTGDIAYVFLNGLQTGASGYLFRGIDPNLKLVGTPDLNGDGHPDLLFQNIKTGDVLYALMNATIPLSYGTLFRGISLEYQIVGTLDLNGDGQEDIVFQGQTNGDVSYVMLNNLAVIGNGYLFHGVNRDFKIVGVH